MSKLQSHLIQLNPNKFLLSTGDYKLDQTKGYDVELENHSNGLTSTDVQGGIDEIKASVDTISSGAVVGASSSTDEAICRFDSTTGKLIQNSTVLINDTGDISDIKTSTYTNLGSAPSNPSAGNTTLYSDGSDYHLLTDTRDIVIGGSSIGSTGVLSGGILSVNLGDDTKFDITAGSGMINNTLVSWGTQTGLSTAYVGFITHLAINSAGVVIYSTSELTPQQRRENIHIGELSHQNSVNLDGVYNQQTAIKYSANSTSDLAGALGVVNSSGNVLSSNSLLTIAKTLGTVFSYGSNYSINDKNPHTKTINAIDTNAGGVFVYRMKDGSQSGNLTSIRPSIYDDGSPYSSAPIISPLSKWSVQRVYITPLNILTIQPGQNIYNTASEARASLIGSNFETEPILLDHAVLIGYLIIRATCADLNNVLQSEILQSGRFGAIIGGTTSVSTLQNVYDNSTLTPEILTSPLIGGLSIKQGTGADTDTQFAIKNGSDTTTFTIDGNGVVVSSNAIIGGLDVVPELNNQRYNSSTSLLTGGELLAGGTQGTFTLSAGTGLYYDVTTNSLSSVSWGASGEVFVTNIATTTITYITVNSVGAIQQYSSKPNNNLINTEIFIGAVIHVNKADVNAINTLSIYGASTHTQLANLMRALGFFNQSGNVFYNDTNDLTLKKTVGVVVYPGINYTNKLDPNNLEIAANIGVNFTYRDQDGVNTASTNTIDGSLWDNAGTPGVVPNNQFTNQRIYLFTSGQVVVLPGQTLYNTLDAAESAASTEPFTTHISVSDNGIFRCILSVKGNASNLNNTAQANFAAVSKFQDTSISGSVNVSNLQSVYDNSVLGDLITTSSTVGPINIKNGQALNTDKIITIKNIAGTETFSVDGDGVVYSNTNATLPITKPFSDTNTIAGVGGGVSMISGAINNTIYGNLAGSTLTNGGNNCYFGYLAGRYNTGSDNIALGYGCLQGVVGSTGPENVCIGTSSGFSITTGFNNTLIGHEAGLNILGGYGNVAIGSGACISLNSGEQNTCIGEGAGNITSGILNTCIGANTSVSPTKINQTSIGYGASCSDEYQITLGNVAVSMIRPSSNNYCTLGGVSNKFSIIYGNKFIGTNGTFDMGLRTDLGGLGTVISTEASDHSVMTVASGCTLIGYQAGNDIVNGGNNTCIGYESGFELINGGSNSLYGVQSGKFLLSGSNNTCVGQSAGLALTSGSNNTFIGSGANGSAALINQTALGYNATCDASNQIVLGNGTVSMIKPMSNNGCTLGDTNNKFSTIFGNKLKITGTSVIASAVVDLSESTLGFLPPKLTTTQRNAIVSPANGLMIYNTTTNKINFYSGLNWESLDSTIA